MSLQRHTVEFNGREIGFSLTHTQRKRLAINVHPDLSVHVVAPSGAPLKSVLAAVKTKARWIARQERFFKQFKPRTPKRLYVSGETHLYLGRQYRLKVQNASGDPTVKLLGGYLHIWCKDRDSASEKAALLERWYRQRAEDVFAGRLTECFAKRPFSAHPLPALEIRAMKQRWGSLSVRGRLLLNLDLMRAPRRCIDYVITHELCHLLVRDHSPAFFRLLTRAMPDWERRKQELERVMV